MVTPLRWLSRRRGAATTEKLLVILFAIVLVGGALMVFGPTVTGKYEQASTMLGGEEKSDTPTLADRPVATEEGANPVWYVVFVIGATVFFLAFVSPLLFPRARRTRQRMLVDLAERFPFLTPLIDPDLRAEEGMGELRDLAREVNDLQRHKDGALKIDAQDLGKIASPAEKTVDADFFERPELDLPTTGPHQIVGNSDDAGARLQLGEVDEHQETESIAPLQERLGRVRGDDGIPFDAVDPSVKPQMVPLDRGPGPAAERVGGDPAESTTIEVADPSADAQGDVLAGEVLRQSSALAAVDDDDLEATIVRDSGASPAVGKSPQPDAPTEVHDDFDRAKLREKLDLPGLDKTIMSNVRAADDPDATTQDYHSFDED